MCNHILFIRDLVILEFKCSRLVSFGSCLDLCDSHLERHKALHNNLGSLSAPFSTSFQPLDTTSHGVKVVIWLIAAYRL